MPAATSRCRYEWSCAVGTRISPSTRRAEHALDQLALALRVGVRAAGERDHRRARGRPPRRRGGSRRRTGCRRRRRSGRSRARARSRGAACRPCGCGGSRAARSRARPSSASSGATGGLPLTTRETVLRLTPAIAATSFMVGRRARSRRSGNVADHPVRRDPQTAGISPDPRAISRVGSTTERGSGSRANSSSPAWRPSAYGSCATTVMPGCDEVAEDDVVEADERHLALPAELAQRPDRADRDQVLAGEQRRRRVAAARAARAPRARRASLSTSSVRSSSGMRAPPQRLVVAAPALGRGEHRQAVAEEGDPAVAVGDQVLDRRARAAGVVAQHGVARHEARRAVDEHERGARLAVAQQVALVARAGHDHQPVHAARGERLGQLALALGPLVRASRRT